MLGWEILVYHPAKPDTAIARWKASVRGLDWLDHLVQNDRATDLGGNGYPNKYTVAADVLLPIIRSWPPINDSPVVIGDDYVLPKGWSSEIDWNQQEALACHGTDQLMVEAWDQS